MEIETAAGAFVPRDTVRRLSLRSNTLGLLQLGLHVGLLCLSGFLVWASRGHSWMAFALLLHGIALCFLFCPLHECIHRTAFGSRWLNDSVAWVCGVVLMLPPNYFRQFHFAHHRFTQDLVRDPELAGPAPATLGAYVWRVSGIPYWLDRLSVTLGHALTGRVRESFVVPQKTAGIVREARILWVCYLVVVAASFYWQRSEALVYWLIPAILGQPFLRLFLLAEHSGCDFTDNMLENTRTTHTNIVVRRLTWCMSYHAEHHAFPAVPFHALREVNRLIEQGVRFAAPGYVAVHRQLLQRLLG